MRGPEQRNDRRSRPNTSYAAAHVHDSITRQSIAQHSTSRLITLHLPDFAETGTCQLDYIYDVLKWNSNLGMAAGLGCVIVFVVFPLFFFAVRFCVNKKYANWSKSGPPGEVEIANIPSGPRSIVLWPKSPDSAC